MKRTLTIVIIILVVLGFGFYLFKISPQEQQGGNAGADFDLSLVKAQSEPAPVGGEDWIRGNPNAKNTLIVYEDYQCPACAAVDDTLNQVPTALQDTKLVFRNFPLYQIHKNSVTAAYAAEAAGAQGKYWEMHDELFNSQSEWAELDNPLDYFANLAQKAGVANVDIFKNDVTSKKYKERVQRDLVEALGMNLSGTPSLFFNGKQIQGGNIEQIKQQAQALYVK